MNDGHRDLEERVKAIEDFLWPGGGPGGPTLFRRIDTKLEELERALAAIEARYVTREEYDEYRRIVAGIRDELQGLAAPRHRGGTAQGG